MSLSAVTQPRSYAALCLAYEGGEVHIAVMQSLIMTQTSYLRRSALSLDMSQSPQQLSVSTVTFMGQSFDQPGLTWHPATVRGNDRYFGIHGNDGASGGNM